MREEVYEHLVSSVTGAPGTAVNAATLRATWKTKRGTYRRTRHDPSAMINRTWPDGPLVQARDTFLAAIDAQGLSPRTIRAYQDTVAAFSAYLLPNRPRGPLLEPLPRPRPGVVRG